MKTYRYTLWLDDASPTVVNPVLEDNQVFEHEKEQDQVFLRKKLGGAALMFCNDDFNLINDAAFTTKFTIYKDELTSPGSYTTRFIGEFYKTDPDLFDEDRKQITVQPEPLDAYKKVIEGMDREFDLIDLAPPTVELDYQLQPLFQVYRQGSNVVTNILSGNFFEQEVVNTPTGATELLNDYVFGYLGSHGVVLGAGEGLDPDVSGEYVDEFGVLISGPTQGWIRKDGVYRVRFDDYTDLDSDMIIERVSDSVELYRGTHANGQDYDTVEFVSALSGDTTKFIYRAWWGRFLTNQETIGAATPSNIPENDIVTSQGTYSKVIGIGSVGSSGTYGTSYADIIIAADDHSVAADRWGKFAADADFHASEYFNKPTGAGTGAIYPLDRGNWEQASFWWQYDSVLRDFQESGAETRTQYNAYKLVDVLQSILTALDTGLTFEESTDCSAFFFDTDNPIRTEALTAVIVPKSNIIVGEYNVPAQKAPIRLSYVLELLYGAHNCKWHVSDPNFVVESWEYYHNGMSYAGPNVGTDLTTLMDNKSGKAWSYKTNKWNYDKSKIPAQIRFKWMDDGSEVFDGFPIEINSPFADQGNIEDIPISLFTADIDYIQLAPENVSKDGFFFGEAVTVDGRLTLPFVELNLGNTGEYKVQNGYAAMVYLQNQYHKYVLPAADVTINLEETTAESVKRTRIQSLTGDEGLPSDVVTDESIMKLVTTNLGSGLVRSYADHTNGGGSELVIEHDI